MSTTYMPRREITVYASATPMTATAQVAAAPAQVAATGMSWLRTDIRRGSAANATAASTFAVRSAVSATTAATVDNAAKAATAAKAGKHGAPPRGNPN